MVMTTRPTRQKMRLRPSAFKAYVHARYTQACDCIAISMAQSQLPLTAHVRQIATMGRLHVGSRLVPRLLSAKVL